MMYIKTRKVKNIILRSAAFRGNPPNVNGLSAYSPQKNKFCINSTVSNSPKTSTYRLPELPTAGRKE